MGDSTTVCLDTWEVDDILLVWKSLLFANNAFFKFNCALRHNSIIKKILLTIVSTLRVIQKITWDDTLNGLIQCLANPQLSIKFKYNFCYCYYYYNWCFWQPTHLVLFSPQVSIHWECLFWSWKSIMRFVPDYGGREFTSMSGNSSDGCRRNSS